MEKVKIEYDFNVNKFFTCPVCGCEVILLDTDKAGDNVECDVCECEFELED